MSDGIRVGTNASLTVAEAARADDGLILGADPDGDRDGEHEREPFACRVRTGGG